MRSEHPGHQLKTEGEAKELLVNEVSTCIGMFVT